MIQFNASDPSLIYKSNGINKTIKATPFENSSIAKIIALFRKTVITLTVFDLQNKKSRKMDFIVTKEDADELSKIALEKVYTGEPGQKESFNLGKMYRGEQRESFLKSQDNGHTFAPFIKVEA